jgi:hypothetical protein
LIIRQRPQNTVGWILSAAGLGTGVTTFSAAYHQYSSSLPGVDAVNMLGNIVWPLNLVIFFILLPLLFPNGHLLSRGWRVVVWLTALVIILDETTGILATLPSARINLFGLTLNSDFWSSVNGSVEPILLPLFLASLVSVILRFVRSRGSARAQMKWLTYGVAVAFSLVVIGIIINDPTNFLFAAAMICVPVSIGISILRYRLYDIDRLISRTLMYLLLSALLALTYLALIFGLQFALRGVTQNSPIPLVISTLAVAALFQPLRRAVQNVIDRSFYRRRYRAEHVLAGFGEVLRTEVDIEELRGHLLEVVRDTMQPDHISLWISAPRPVDRPERG